MIFQVTWEPAYIDHENFEKIKLKNKHFIKKIEIQIFVATLNGIYWTHWISFLSNPVSGKYEFMVQKSSRNPTFSNNNFSLTFCSLTKRKIMKLSRKKYIKFTIKMMKNFKIKLLFSKICEIPNFEPILYSLVDNILITFPIGYIDLNKVAPEHSPKIFGGQKFPKKKSEKFPKKV